MCRLVGGGRLVVLVWASGACGACGQPKHWRPPRCLTGTVLAPSDAFDTDTDRPSSPLARPSLHVVKPAASGQRVALHCSGSGLGAARGRV